MDADAFFLEQDKRMGLSSDDFEHMEGIVTVSSERLGGTLTNPAAQPTHVLPTNAMVSADSAPLQRFFHEPAAPKPDIAPHMAETSSSHSLPTSGPKAAELQQYEHYESIAPAVDSSPAILNSIAGASRSFNEPSRSPAEGQCNSIISRLISSPSSPLSVSLPKPRTHLPQSDVNEPAPTDQMVAVSTGNIMEEPASSIEEISSFTPTPRRKKRPIDTIQASREGSDDQSTAQAKGLLPPKKRRTSVSKPTKTATVIPDRHDPLTSPIEDPDSSFASATIESADNRAVTSLKAAPSKLYLQVKERVATHAASRGKGKPVKLAPGARQVAPITLKDVSTVDPPSSAVSHCSRSSPPATANASANTKSKTRVKAEKSNNKLAKGKQKEEPKLTPVEYARRTRERLVFANGSKQTSTVKFLDGLNIFYVGGDLHFASQRTRGRMDIIVKYGGNLLPTYDSVLTTHIVTDAGARPTLRTLGLKKLSDIPDHIPTVKWSWVISGIGRSPSLSKDGLKVPMDQTWMHTAFVERIDAGVEPAPSSKGKNKVAELADISDISMFTQDKGKSGDRVKVFYDSEDDDEQNSETGTSVQPRYPQQSREFREVQPTTNSAGAPKYQAHDPLSAFYAQARAQLDQKRSRHGEAEESETSSDDEIQDPLPRKFQSKRGWTCDSKQPQTTQVPNQDVINKLEELRSLHQAKPSDDDRWRVFSYTKCIRALRNYPKRLESFAEAQAIRGVGDKTAAKIMEILETGNLRRIDYENTEDVKVTRLFNGIYGVGQSTAYRWYAAGCRTLQDILDGKNGVTLSAAQEIGIRYYEDINDRMPREEAKTIFDLIKPIALSIDSQLFIDIMGSYRRGKADCGDIDILITRPTDDGRTHLGVLPRLLNALHAAGILTEDLAVPEDFNELEAVYRGLCHIPRGAALLYYTGDDIFNRAIRLKADSMGYSLNQRGLFAGIIRDPRDRRVKLNSGILVASETEEEIFKILDVPWQEPHERVRG